MRTKIKTNDRLKRTVIALVFLAVLVLTVWVVWFFVSMQSVTEELQTAALPAAVAPIMVGAANADELLPVPPAPEAVVQEGEPVQSVAAVVKEAPVQLAAPESPWTGPLNTVGIAPADQPIVIELSMTGFEWNLLNCACYTQVHALSSNESRFHYLNIYVERHYGTWSAARDHFAAKGNW